MSSGDGQPQLAAWEYELLREVTRTHREELLVRLCGEAGLRAGEIARMRPSDLSGDGENGRQQFVQVREADGGQRIGYLPASVAHDFWQYVRSNEIDEDAELIEVTERRVQMLIRELSERASEQTGRAVFERATPSTLRTFFARQLLVEHGVDARVVAAVGGWEGVDALLAGLDSPTRAEVETAFEQLDTATEDRSGRLSRLIDLGDSVTEQLVTANSRETIERHSCEALTADGYSGAWIIDRGRPDRLTVRASAGEHTDRFDGSTDGGIARRALQSGQSVVEPDDSGPTTRQDGVLAAVALTHGETSYGALVVRARTRDAFGDAERTGLETLGRQIAFAISAVERKQVLLGGAVLELQFQYEEGALLGLAEAVGSPLVLDGAVAGADGVLCFVRLLDTTPKTALQAAASLPGVGDSRLIRSSEEGDVIEVALQDDSPLLLLAERGGTVTDLRIENGQARVTCEMSPDVNVRAIRDELRERFPSVELRSKQERERTRTDADSRGVLDERLTEKQRSVLETAYHAGYFEWPRGSTAEDLAESMDVSPPTLHNHLRKAQQNLLEQLLDQ